MLQTMRRRRGLIAGLVAVTLVTAACGGDDDSGGDASGNGDGGLSGSIVISGSSTVEPISVAVADKFDDANPGVSVSVDGPGTGDGFELFCQGQTDISDASRAIKDEEVTACQEAGIEFIELKVAFDGIGVMGHPDNPLSCLSFADMYALVGPESEDVDRWSDAASLAGELGSDTTFPDLPLEISAPGEESGTFDSFIELALEDIAEERDQDATTRLYSGQANDNVIIDGIAGSDGAFGWVGYAFAANAQGVKVFEVEGEDGTCVPASDETIADGTYPLSRPLFIYVNKAAADERPEVAAFVDFYLNDAIDSVSEVGFVSLPEDQMQATRDTWTNRATGKQA